MDESGRKITKIAREAGKFTLKMMKEEESERQNLILSISSGTIPASHRRKSESS